MSTIKKSVVMNIGATFTETWNVFRTTDDEYDLDGFDAECWMFQHPTSEEYHTLDASVNATAKTVTVTMAANTTATIEEGVYVFEVDLFAGGDVIRIIEGKIEAKGRSTQ